MFLDDRIQQRCVIYARHMPFVSTSLECCIPRDIACGGIPAILPFITRLKEIVFFHLARFFYHNFSLWTRITRDILPGRPFQPNHQRSSHRQMHPSQ